MVYYVLSVAASLATAFCEPSAGAFRPEEVIARERAALDRWSRGEPDGFLDSYAADITYFDPTTDARVSGIEAMKARLAPVKGKLKVDRYEMLDPKVQRDGEMAVLSYNLVNYTRQPDGSEKAGARWNSSSVYRRSGGVWQTIHSHWSLVKPVLKDAAPATAGEPGRQNSSR
jgi:ketosteroid isomerase-like protein